MPALMCLLSPMVPHATCYISIMYVSSIEFHIDTEIIFCQCYHTQTTPNLIISCWVLAKYSFKINKVLIAEMLLFGLFILIICLATSLFLSLSWFAQGPWYCCYQVCLFIWKQYLFVFVEPRGGNDRISRKAVEYFHL